MQKRMWSVFAFMFVCLFVSSALYSQDEAPPAGDGVIELQKKETPPAATTTEQSPSDKPTAETEGDKKEEKKEEKKESASEKSAREKKERTEGHSSAFKARSEGKFWFSTYFITWRTQLVGIGNITPIYGRGVLGQQELVHFWSPTMLAKAFPQLHTGEFTKVAGQIGGGVVLFDETNVGPQCCVYSVDAPVVMFQSWNEETKTWGDPVYGDPHIAEGEIVKEGHALRAWKFVSEGPGMMIVYLPAQ